MAASLLRMATGGAPILHFQREALPGCVICMRLRFASQETLEDCHILRKACRRLEHLHDKSHLHVRVAGGFTANSVRYPLQMCLFVMQHLFPDKFYSTVPAMPCKPFEQHEHVEKEIPISHVFSAVHQLIERGEWIKDPAAKEAEGLVAEGTWGYKEVVSRSDLVARAKASGKKIQLMTIMSWQHPENPQLKKLKARIVFRGDNERLECGEFTIFQEIRVTPTGISRFNLKLM